MSAHAPGPWYATEGLILDADAHCIASLVDEDGEYTDPQEGPANARLIAAAPELLRALQEYVRDFGDNEDADSRRMADTARAAIAKATQS